MRTRTSEEVPKKKNGAADGISETMSLEENNLGDIRIHENVIATLARRSALSVDGVARMAGSALVDNIAEIVGSRRLQARAIAIEINDKGQISLELKLVLKAGYRIPEVAEKVQQAVIAGIESVTGMTVLTVHVSVQEIDEPEPENPGETNEENNGIPF